MVNFAKVANRTLVVATHDLALLEAFDEVVQFENLNQFAPDHS
jgi:ABC-type transport system involved in cytochrome bd biosynthesis fused ATPase/permease subunit